jgi:hypothetical protein
MKQLANLRQQLAAVYNSISCRVAALLRFVSRIAIWLAAGSRAWITLKPASRPRRTARRAVVVLAKRQELVVAGKLLLAPFPTFRVRLQTIIRSHREDQLRQALPPNQPNLSAEPEGVRQIYQQLLWARKVNLTRM